MKTIRLLTLLSSLVCLASCSSDNDELFPDPYGDRQIKFEMSFAGEGDNNPKTKVTTADDFTSSWMSGDKIGVYIVKGSGGLLASGNYADNVEFTYNYFLGWTTTNPQYYPNDGDILSFYAYYPYDASMTNPNAYIFNVPTDQSYNTGEYFNKNDFLWAKQENFVKSNNAVALQFSHALAMIQFYTECDLYSNSMSILVNLNEVVTDCTINLSTQNIGIGNTKNNIKMYQSKFVHGFMQNFVTCRALIPPQTMDILFVWNDRDTDKYYSSTPKTNVTLTGGKVNKYENR